MSEIIVYEHQIVIQTNLTQQGLAQFEADINTAAQQGFEACGNIVHAPGEFILQAMRRPQKVTNWPLLVDKLKELILALEGAPVPNPASPPVYQVWYQSTKPKVVAIKQILANL